jgi:hypothetical protein
MVLGTASQGARYGTLLKAASILGRQAQASWCGMHPFEESHAPPARQRASFASHNQAVERGAWGSLFESRIGCAFMEC